MVLIYLRASASVLLASQYESKNQVAIKIIEDQMDFNKVRNEVEILKRVVSPYVVKYFGCFQKNRKTWVSDAFYSAMFFF